MTRSVPLRASPGAPAEAASPQRRVLASALLFVAAFWYGVAAVGAGLFVWTWREDGLRAAGYAAPLCALSLVLGVLLTWAARKTRGKKEL